MYMGPDGNRRSAGICGSRRAALRAAQRDEQLVLEGRWRDRRLGEMPFADYVENVWFPSKHLELSTRAGYPKIIARRTRTLTPEEFGRLIAALPVIAAADGLHGDRDRPAVGRADCAAASAH
jgi:hypothetical protein